MKVWYDACTGKHVRYGVAIATRLRAIGHDVVLTTRKHPDTVQLAEFLGEDFIVIGRYKPGSLATRLREGLKRQLALCKIFKGDVPDVAISHGSVDQCRVAFGLGKPIVLTFDTPYAEAVNRLTLPLSDHIIASKAIPRRVLQAYGIKGKVTSFNGVDEVAWIKGFKPEREYDFGKPLIVCREFEGRAVYAKGGVDLIPLAKKLTKLGKVVLLRRYRRRTVKGLIVPSGFVDSASLTAHADLFIGTGGTITREAALQGTPAIVIKALPRQHVNEFLARKGFPIFNVSLAEAPKLAEKLLGKRKDVSHMLEKLENPVDVIANILSKL